MQTTEAALELPGVRVAGQPFSSENTLRKEGSEQHRKGFINPVT